MDFAPVIYSAPERSKTRRIVAGIVSLGVGLATVPTGLALLDGVLSISEAFLPSIGVTLLIGTAIVSSSVPEARAVTRKEKRKEELRAAFNGHYGLRMSSDDFAGLSYPDVQPSSDFEVFGSMLQRERVSESSFVELKIYLVWMDSRFQLSKSKDGKSFKELKPARQELAAAPQKSALSERPAPLALPA